MEAREGECCDVKPSQVKVRRVLENVVDCHQNGDCSQQRNANPKSLTGPGGMERVDNALPPMKTSSSYYRCSVGTRVETILDWPTNTFYIDYYCHQQRSSSNQDQDNNNEPIERQRQEEHHDIDKLVVPHTFLVFIPGNPGLIEWYIDFFHEIVKRLGPGYAVRGISNAGHQVITSSASSSTSTSRRSRRRVNDDISHTIDGQVIHKIEYIDRILVEWRKIRKMNDDDANNNNEEMVENQSREKKDDMNQKEAEGTTIVIMKNDDYPKLIFVSHSIGCHFTQRLLIRRDDILRRTQVIIHLMPFIRMKAPRMKQFMLNAIASSSSTTTSSIISATEIIMGILRRLPYDFVDRYLMTAMLSRSCEENARQIASNLVRSPTFAKSFLMLGTEEIRDVPEEFDVHAMRYIASHHRHRQEQQSYHCGHNQHHGGRVVPEGTPTFMLIAGNDQWFPKWSIDDIKDLQRRGIIPGSDDDDDHHRGGGSSGINVYYRSELQHDFVLIPKQVKIVVDYCVHVILMHTTSSGVSSKGVVLDRNSSNGGNKRIRSKL